MSKVTSTTTLTSIPKETQIITTVINGTTTAIPAYQTGNTTLFPNITSSKTPATTVYGPQAPLPFDPYSALNNAKESTSVWKSWMFVIVGVVLLAIVGGFVYKKYNSGRKKKIEPGNFMSVDEEEEAGGLGGLNLSGSNLESGMGGGASRLSRPHSASAISLGSLGGVLPGDLGIGGSSNSTVRRNSFGLQTMPKAANRS